MSLVYDMIKRILLDYQIYSTFAAYGAALGTFILLVILTMILFFISKTILMRIIGRLMRHTKGIWDDLLYQHKFFQILTHFIPAILIYSSSGFAAGDLVWLPSLILGIGQIYILLVFVVAVNRFLDAAQDVYNTYPYAKGRTIKGYIQLMKILIYCAGTIFLIAILIGQNPGSILTGLGAATAILAFVFRDPILGFVASIQLTANKMVKQGDWITVPKFNIDGTVEDITLTTVKIQNWDKTITTIPTYSLVSESVINWVGMLESGGRRIQRSVNIDMTSVRFCDQLLIEKMKKSPFLNDFFIRNHHDKQKPGLTNNGHALTNLSLFKQYLGYYIKFHPDIHKKMTQMVRFLPSSERGLPIELIFFSKKQDAEAFEDLQADIFDHILAILPEFDLRVFQNPSGNIYPLHDNVPRVQGLRKDEHLKI